MFVCEVNSLPALKQVPAPTWGVAPSLSSCLRIPLVTTTSGSGLPKGKECRCTWLQYSAVPGGLPLGLFLTALNVLQQLGLQLLHQALQLLPLLPSLNSGQPVRNIARS